MSQRTGCPILGKAIAYACGRRAWGCRLQQRDLAELLECSRSKIAQIENGHRAISERDLRKIEERLGGKFEPLTRYRPIHHMGWFVKAGSAGAEFVRDA